MEDAGIYNPEIILLMPNNVTFFTKEFLRQVKSRTNSFVAARFGDPCSYDREKVTKNLEIAEFVDHFIADDGEFADTAHTKGLTNVEYIPPFVNEQLGAVKNEEKIFDILFTGAGHLGLKMYDSEFMYARRRNFIKKVVTSFPGSLKVIGRGWNDLNLIRWKDDFVSEDVVHNYIQKSKIVIAYDGPYTKGFTSGRTFRAIMSGAFLLIRYFPGIENIFINHKHLVWFHSDEEGLELIDYYLKNGNEREKIARSGYSYLIDKKGWRRKNIIVDYLIEKYKGSGKNFGALFGSYFSPVNFRTNKELTAILNSGRINTEYYNLYDMLILAEKCMDENDLIKARKILGEIIIYDPHFTEAVIDLSVLEIMEGDYDEALALIEQILSYDPENEIARANRDYLFGLITHADLPAAEVEK